MSRIIIGFLMLAVVLVACGSDDDQKDQTESVSAPTITSISARPVITTDNITALQRLPASEPGPLYDIVLTEDGETLVVIARNGLALYTASDLTPQNLILYEQAPFAGGGTNFLDVGSPLGAEVQGTTVSFVSDEQQWFIDIATGEQRSEPAPADYERPDAALTSPDGQWEVTSGRDPQTRRKIVMVHNVNTGAEYDLNAAFCGGRNSGFAVVFHPDSTRLYTATGPANGTIMAWDLTTGEISAMRGGFAPDILDMVLLPETNTLLVAQGELNFRPQAVFCPDEHNPNNGIFAYNLADGTSSPLDLPGVLYPEQIAASADGQVLLVRESTMKLTLWDHGNIIQYEVDPSVEESPRNPALYLDYAISADGQYIAGMHPREIAIWDRETLMHDNTPRLVYEFDESELDYDFYGMVRYQGIIAFVDSRLIAADINALRVWDAASGDAQTPLELPLPVSSVAAAGDTLAVSVSSGYSASVLMQLPGTLSEAQMDELRERYGMTDISPTVNLYQLDNGELVQRGAIEASTFDWLALNPDASLVAVEGYDDTAEQDWIYFYDATTSALLHRIEGRFNIPPTFSADGTLLIISGMPPHYGLEFWGIPED
jgi:WD40 repeat protein